MLITCFEKLFRTIYTEKFVDSVFWRHSQLIQLYSDVTTTLLMPSVRSIGPLTMDQIVGAIPGPLPPGQILLLVWPQITGLIASTILCFVFSYISFMKKEIRSR